MTAQGTKTAFRPPEPRLSETEFLGLAERLPDWSLEYLAGGTLIFMPPTDPLTSRRNALIVHRLTAWADPVASVVSGPDGGFLLPDGSRMAPDAAWFSLPRFEAAQLPGVRFPVFAPEFVVELRSPSDRRRGLEDKMESWIANGVQLGWLIDPIDRAVTLYRPDRDPEVRSDPGEVPGEGPLVGFILSMDRILS